MHWIDLLQLWAGLAMGGWLYQILSQKNDWKELGNAMYWQAWALIAVGVFIK